MTLPEEGLLLRIFIGESDKKEGMPLYEWLLRKAKESGIAGATVFRGSAGFGAHSRIHSAKILDLSADLPMLIEIIDSPEKINGFMQIVDEAVSEGLATLEKVQIKLYRGGNRAKGTGK